MQKTYTNPLPSSNFLFLKWGGIYRVYFDRSLRDVIGNWVLGIGYKYPGA